MTDSAGRSKSKVVCVLGMHRSGTSLVSRILGLMGLSHGPAEHMMGPAEFNPRGHWEYQPLVDLNDAILAAYGGSWDAPPLWPEAWHRDSSMDSLRAEARNIFERDFSGTNAWVWKDPRTSLTLPFWHDLVPGMRYVVCLRNPLDVALSLQGRDGFSLVKGGDLWLTYVASAFLHTSALPRMFLFYEDLIRDWKPQVQRLAAFLGDPRIPETGETESSIEDFIDRSLEHYRSLPEQALSEGAIPFPARALYSFLQSQPARQPEGADGFGAEGRRADSLLELFVKMALEAHIRIDEQRQLEESEDRAETLRATLAESQRRLAESEAREETIQANLAESQGQAATLQANLAESQGQTEGLVANVAESNRHLAEGRTQADTLRAALAERDLALEGMEHSLYAIRESRSWKLTGPFRWLAGRIRALRRRE